MELLSPAGNREALIAAVQNGADAVYLGYTAFGARSYAGNFDEAGLAEAVRYCHERGRRVYVTVNTLVKEPEMDDAADVLEMLCRRGADAVLVQDLGLAALCRERFPDLALHASTQMTIHNAQGVRLLREMGFTRVVPARECPLEEIRLIAAEGLETEVFVHGALCVSVSGQCLFSGIIGGRSGNRGKCAQPCRMRYRRPDGVQGCLLCTRDLMLLQRLPELRDAGVDSLKIEGRMKRPEYVAVVTAAYRRALDCAQRGEPYAPDEATCQALRQIFNRGGFTEGYLMDKNNAALMSWERPGHFGVPVGRVERVRGELAGVRLERELSADEAALSASISNLATDDMTSLYDALYASVERMAAQDGARCVIAFTDGDDNYSSCTMDDVIEVANRYRVPVFIIGIGSVDASGVQAICDATGGAYYSIASVGSMAELYDSIYRMEKELYLLEFTDSTGASVSDAASIQVGYAGEDYAGSCSYSYTPNVLLSAESSTIFMDGPEATVERYLKNFDDAMTYTDFSRISDCLKPGSAIYTEQEAYVTRGISEELDSYEISPASYSDDAHATVSTRETFYVQVPGKPLQLMTQECTYALERVGDTWLMTSFVDLEVTNRINQ